MSDTERNLEKLSREEFDVDTGTYMEDVHANDHIIGRDGDSDGLIDDVEKLIANASERADAFNEEKERNKEREHQRQQGAKEDKDMGL